MRRSLALLLAVLLAVPSPVFADEPAEPAAAVSEEASSGGQEAAAPAPAQASAPAQTQAAAPVQTQASAPASAQAAAPAQTEAAAPASSGQETAAPAAETVVSTDAGTDAAVQSDAPEAAPAAEAAPEAAGETAEVTEPAAEGAEDAAAAPEDAAVEGAEAPESSEAAVSTPAAEEQEASGQTQDNTAEAAPASEAAAPAQETAPQAEQNTAFVPAEGTAADVADALAVDAAGTEAAPEETAKDAQEAAPFGVQTGKVTAPLYAEDVTPAATQTAGEGDAAETTAGSTEEKPEDRKIALQLMIKDKLSKLSSFSGRQQIILAKNTTYEGDVEIEKGDDQEIADDFELQFVSEDALDEEGKVIEGGGSGKTTINGALNIKGMNVLLNGVSVALGKKITVSEASFTYEGVAGNDSLDVDLGKNAAATITTYGGDDAVTVNAYEGASGTTIKTGDDDDSVTVNSYSGTVDIDTGDGKNTVKANLYSGTGASSIKTGKGKDKVQVVTGQSAGTTVETGAGADTVTVETRYGADNVSVATGDGDDTVEVSYNDDLISGSPSGQIKVDLGSGVARLNVDMSVAKGFAVIDTKAGAGSQLHLTGELAKYSDDDPNVKWVSDAKEAIRFKTDDGNLDVTVKDFEFITDALKNQRTVKLSEANGQFEDFTDYEIDEASLNTKWNGDKTRKTISLKNSIVAPGGLVLSDLLFESKAVKNADTLDVGDLDARGLNLLIRGDYINIVGKIIADNITVDAYDGLNQNLHEWELDSFESAVNTAAFSISDIVNIKHDAIVNIEGSARLYARGNIGVTATIDQKGGLLEKDFGIIGKLAGKNYNNLDKIFNPINVKVGDAEVNIKEGAILSAGYGYDGKAASTGYGSVNIDTKIKAEASAGKDAVHLPIAASVLVENAETNVEKGATINAARNISVNTESTLTAQALTESKMIPLALAVDVIVNNVHTNVNGNLTAGKDVSATATGEVTSDTRASRGKGISGVYLSTNVVVQDVEAVLQKNAVVTAGGGVDVKSTANVTANTISLADKASFKEEEEKKETEEGITEEKTDSKYKQIAKGGLGFLKEYLGKFGSWLKKKAFFDKPDTRNPVEKTNDLLDSVAGSDYQVTLADDSEQKGDVKLTTGKDPDGMLEGVWTTVKIDPWPGHAVDKVWYTYIDNQDGADAAETYTIKTAIQMDDGNWKIPSRTSNIRVYVDYKDSDDDSSTDDYDVSSLFEEKEEDQPMDLDDFVSGSINGVEDEDDDDISSLMEDSNDSSSSGSSSSGSSSTDSSSSGSSSTDTSTSQPVYFNIIKTSTEEDNAKWTVGSLLNTEFDHTTGKSSLKTAIGEKVTFIVNAKKGWKIKDDGVVVSYYKKGEEKEQKVVLKADAKGQYVFTVPADIELRKYTFGQADGAASFKVTSEFEKETEDKEYKADTTKTQINGSVAVTVVSNDNLAVIEEGAAVTADGDVSFTANQKTEVNTNTSAAAVSKIEQKEEEKEEKQEDQQKLLTQYLVPGQEVAVVLSETNGGTVKTTQNSAYTYTFTPQQNGKDVISSTEAPITMTIRYKSGGSWKTATISAGSDGKFSLNLNKYVIDKGTTVQVSFAFPDSTKTTETQALANLVDHPISVVYNVQKLSKEEDPYDVSNKKLGEVYYVKKTTKDGETRYYFNIDPDSDNGYTVDAADAKDDSKSNTNALWAVYKDGSGAEKKIALHQDAGSNYWYVSSKDMKDAAVGSTITVNARFTEDKRDIKKVDGYKADERGGDVTFDKDKAKATDTVTMTLTANKNYAPYEVTVFYTDAATGKEQQQVLKPDEDGKVKFTMPSLADGTSIRVNPSFTAKTLTLQKDSASKDVSLKTDEKVFSGQKIEVTLTDDAKKAGKKLNNVATVTYFDKETGNRKQVQVDIKDGKIVVPDGIKDATTVTVAVNAVDKAITLEDKTGTIENGTLTLASTKADPGEKIEVAMKPADGYRLKDGSVTVDITTDTSTYHVKATRKDANTLTFTLPSTLSAQELTAGKVSIAMKSTFEKGWADGENLESSYGAALALTVANTDNDAQVKGGTIKADGVSVSAETNNSSKAIASAGYTKAETGFAGGLGINVSSFDTTALVKNNNTKITANSLGVSASGTHGFETTGSAAGAKDAAETGIGSGISVAVDSADVAAGIQDGTNLILGDGSISASAANKTDDKVTAKAGATADTGITPVIAVDVIGTSADAYIGNVAVDGSTANALKTNNVSVTASNTAGHTSDADASVTGGKAAMGGAFDVNVIHDRAMAQLQKSVDADKEKGSLSVSSTSIVTEKATATASASGGVKGKSGDKGSAGSADKQTDKILGGAGGMASKNNSKSLSMKGSGSADRQKAQTSEGSIAGAAAIAVNVLGTSSTAKIIDGVNVKSGDVSVNSLSKTDVTVKANGSTAKSDTGVGVAVAVNVVNIDNIAEIGNGTIDAGKLTVTAVTPEKSKNATDDVEVVKMPEDEDKMVLQLSEYIKDGLNKLIAARYGIDQQFIGELAATFSKSFVDTILKETGLTDLLGKGTFEERKDKALSSLNELLGDLKNYPKALLEPLATIFEEAEGMGDADAKRIGNILIQEVTTQLPALLKSTVMGTLNRAKDDMGSKLIEMINYKLKGKSLDTSWDDLKKILKNAAMAEWNTLSAKIVEDVMTRLRSELPLLTTENYNKVKKLFTTSFQEKKEAFVDNLTSTFQDKVFNYAEAADKIRNTDFKKMAEEMLRKAMSEGTTAVSNQVLDTVLSKLDVQLVPEDNSDKHVIVTQAIAGSGAKNVGIAGSVAIGVLNSDTKAVVNSGAAMTVDHETIVNARENRKVDSTATAALDSKGKADKNKDGGKKEQKDTGSGDAAESKTMAGNNYVVKSKAGAEVEQDLDDPTIVWITPKDGYLIETGADKAEFTYLDDENKEKTEKLEVYSKTENGVTKYYVKTSDAKKVDGKTTTITVTPKEDLHTISGVSAISFSVDDDDTKNVPDNTVSVTVDGRDEAAKDGKLNAKKTDTVKVTVDKTKMKGYKVESIDYLTADGKLHKVEVSTTESDTEAVFSFEMPAQNVNDITVYFEKLEDGEQTETKTTDDKGRSVGVGAAFSMIYGDSNVKAEINRDITSGTLTVKAESDHEEDITSVAGTDPLSGDLDTDATKDFSLDASVALNVLDNDISAAINGKSKTTETAEGDEAKIDDEHNVGDYRVISSENAVTDTHASSYATGNSTAIGAAVAINIASSDVRTTVNGDVSASGAATISSNTHSEDDTKSFATAMGASISRNLAKAGEKVSDSVESVQKILDGSIFNKKDDDKKEDKNSNNDTAKKINAKLDKKQASDGQKADTDKALSTNALRNQNVTTEDGSSADDATKDAAAENKEATGKDATGSGNKGDKQSYQVAAALGLTITDHAAETVVTGNISAKNDIRVSSENTDNYNTLGTGIAMSLAKASNSIAAGIAVSVNQNKANVDMTGGLNSTSGNVDATANLTQNMDGLYRGKLGAQALAGSVSGADSKMSIGGAVSVLVSNAKATVNIQKGTGTDGAKINGKQVTVSAQDKSKLAVRAGGVSISRGSSVGMGLSAAAVKSSNTVTANVGDGFTITGSGFDLTARKLGVSMKDYVNPVPLTDVITDSSKLTDEQRKEANTGIIDLHKGKDDKSYKIEVNLSSEDVLKAVDLLNFLSSTNYYAEAMAGSIMTGGGDSKLSAAGSFSIVDMKNVVKAELGKDTTVTLTKADDNAVGDMNVKAESESNTRMIAGALSAAPSKAGVGLTFAYLGDNDDVKADVGSGSKINVAGSFDEQANVTSFNQLFTAAASIAAGSNAKAAVGGSVNVITAKNKAKALLGEGTTVTSGNKANVSSDTDMDLTLVSVSAAGTSGKAAVGGTVNVVVDEAESVADIGAGASLAAQNDTTVKANVAEQLISVGASASAATSGSSAAVAGAISTLISRSKAFVNMAKNVKLSSAKESVGVHADSDTMMVNALLSAAGAGTAAVGAAIGVNVYKREAKINIAGSDEIKDDAYDFSAAKNVAVQAKAQDRTISAGLAIAGAGTAAVSGNIQATVGKSVVENKVADKIAVKADGSVAFESDLNDFFVNALGSIAVSGGAAGVGAAILTVVKKNTVETGLGASKVYAGGKTDVTLKNGETLKGIQVSANAKETQFIAGAGVGVASNAGITGVVVTDVTSNTVKADTTKAILDAYKNAGTNATNVNVTANDDTRQILLAGGVNVGATAGIGASVVTLVSGKTVSAESGTAKAVKDVNVTADNKDHVTMLAISAGGAGTVAVEVGAAIQVLRSAVKAQLSTEAYSHKGNVNVLANNKTDLFNSAVTAAGAGAAAITPTAVVTYFKGSTEALVAKGTNVTFGDVSQAARSMNVKADSTKNIDLYSIGASAGGTAGVSGTANILVAKDTTSAKTGEDTTIDLGKGAFDSKADSAYNVTAGSGAIAVGGVAGVAVNAVVNILKGKTEAELAGTVTAGKVDVNAYGSRDVNMAAVTGAGGGVAAVGATVLVLNAGERMSKDAVDGLMYGNADSKTGEVGADDDEDEEEEIKADKTFDVDRFMKASEAQGADTSELYDKDEDGNVTGSAFDDLSNSDSKGDSEVTIGTEGQAFDAESGYRSKEFDRKSKKDTDETQRGEEQGDKMAESKNIEKSKTQGEHTFSKNLEDAVTAKITDKANLTVTDGSVKVKAEQPTLADVFGGTVGVAGVASIGAGVAVVQTRSNVSAESLGTINGEGSTVEVKANSYADSKEIAKDSDEAERTAEIQKYADKSLLEKLDPNRRSIRAVSLTLSGGLVGVGAAVSSVRADNVTNAVLGGKVTGVKKVDVQSDSNYDNVLAATLAVGGGVVGLSASVAMSQAEGSVAARMDSTADISTDEAAEINVKTNTTQNANALAAGAAIGLGAANAGVSIASNKLTQTTSIDGGAKVNVGEGSTINVKGVSDTRADAELLSIAGGIVAANISAAKAHVQPTMNTGIGIQGDGKAVINTNGEGSVNVENVATSTATPKLAAITAGGAALSGSALLAYNDSDARAKIANADVDTGSILVNSVMRSTGTSELTSATIGALASGINSNYVDINSVNHAILDTTGGTIHATEGVTVKNGDRTSTSASSKADGAYNGYLYDSYSNAKASTVAGAVGLINTGSNEAIARNRAVNTAQIIGEGTFENEGDTNVKSFSKGTAVTSVAGLSIGAADTVSSTSIALNEANSMAMMHQSEAFQNDGDMNFASVVAGKTDASMITGGGSLLSAKTNTAASYGRTRSLIDVDLKEAPEDEIGMINAETYGEDQVNATVTNATFSALKVSGLVGAAYNQDEFQTKIKLGGGTYTTQGVNARTSFDTRSTANVTPTSSGYDASLGGLQINVATARNTAYMNTELDVENGMIDSAGAVDVLTNGTATADATIKGAEISLSVVELAANVANADVSTKQAAMINLNKGTVSAEEKVTVNSTTTKDTAKAITGASGGKNSGIKISALSGGTSNATAKENAQSTVGIMGSGHTDNRIIAPELELSSLSGKNNNADASISNPATLGLFTAGNLDAESLSTESHMTMLTGLTANIDGDTLIRAKADARANSLGSSPGSLTVAEVSVSTVKAGVGSKDDKQKAQVVIGENVILTSENTTLEAVNNGMAKADMYAKNKYGLGEINKSSQPTESWYETSVAIGKKADIRATELLTISAKEEMDGESIVDGDSTGILFNLNSMKGSNTMYGDSTISVGESAKLSSGGDLSLAAVSNSNAVAKTMFNGGFGFLSGNEVQAENTVDRKIKVNIGNHVRMESLDGKVYIATASGMEDHIETQAHVKAAKGIIELSNAKAESNLSSETKINIGGDVKIEGADTVEILNTATTHGKIPTVDFTGVPTALKKIVASLVKNVASVTPGVYTSAGVDSAGIGVSPTAKAYTNLDLDTEINIAKNWKGDKTYIGKADAQRGSSIRATNQYLNIQTNALAVGKALGGKAQGDGQTHVKRMINTIYVDNAVIKTTKGIRALSADNGEDYPAFFYTSGRAEFFGAVGEVNPIAKIDGTMGNYIQTHNTTAVDGGNFWTNEYHQAQNPKDTTDVILKADFDRLEIKIFGFTITGTVAKVVKANDLVFKYACDFCGSGEHNYDIDKRGSADETQAEISGVVDAAIATALSRLDTLKNVFEKALEELVATSTKQSGKPVFVVKAGYDEEEEKAAGAIYNTVLKKLLGEDVTLPKNLLDRYHIWDNLMNSQNVYMLPNATRLMAAAGKFRYVSEVLRGDALGFGETQTIDVITALTKNAYDNPVISIGKAGSLDFAKSALRLFESSELELFEYEISADWLKEKFGEGYLRALSTDIDQINEIVYNGAAPEGDILEGVTEAADLTDLFENGENLKAFWVGQTPEDTDDEDLPLYFLVIDDEEDQVQAFRTSIAMLRDGKDPVRESICLYRDSKSDRMGEDKYDVIFYDTPEGEKSTVKLITNVLAGRELEIPKSLTITLREFAIDGVELPVFSISDHLFVMNNGTTGAVELFDGFYKASFNGNTFDSDYTRIDGIATGDLQVTLKKDQEIWPENVSDSEAVTVSGDQFLKVGDEWVEQTDTAEETEETEATAAA